MDCLVDPDKVNECNYHMGLFNVTYRSRARGRDIYQRGIPICFTIIVSIDGKQKYVKFFAKGTDDVTEEDLGQTLIQLRNLYNVNIKRLLVDPKLNKIERFIPIANSREGARVNLAVKQAGLKLNVYAIIWHRMNELGLSYEDLPNYPELILEAYAKVFKSEYSFTILNNPIDLLMSSCAAAKSSLRE